MVNLAKFSILIFFIVGMIFICGCSGSQTTPTQTSMNEQASMTSAPIPTPTNEVFTKFEQFENGLNSANIAYETTTMAADLIGAEEGRKYQFNGESVELYRFNEDSEEFQDVLQYKAVKLEGFGSFPAEINGNMVLLTKNLTNKDKISEIFLNLK